VEFAGYDLEVLINGASVSPSANSYALSLRDSIYSAFPSLEIAFSDPSGAFLEYGTFWQGTPVKINFGIAAAGDLLKSEFRVIDRDVVKSGETAPGLSGNLKITALHKSFFENRESPDLALKEMTVSDAVKKLFPLAIVEDTRGEIEAYAFDDPYSTVREILLPQATNGKIRPYCFFRTLEGSLYFESIERLEGGSPMASLELRRIDAQDENMFDIMNSFLPFQESLGGMMEKLHAEGKLLKNDLSFEVEDKSVAADAKYKIPVMADTRIHHDLYFHRQFNPKVDYGLIKPGLYADAMRAGFFIDKAVVNIPFHPKLTAGKTVKTEVSIYDASYNAILSETFSGIWLIEQSDHLWDGMKKRAGTSLVLCRSSLKPRSDSMLNDNSFKD
jgi:hypothetical protein